VTARSEAFTALTVNSTNFWVVTSCSPREKFIDVLVEHIVQSENFYQIIRRYIPEDSKKVKLSPCLTN
jgi:hypothetical protein